MRHVERLFPIGIPEQLWRNSAGDPSSSGHDHGHLGIVVGDPGEHFTGEGVDSYALLVILVGIGSCGGRILIGIGHVAWLVPRTCTSRGAPVPGKEPGFVLNEKGPGISRMPCPCVSPLVTGTEPASSESGPTTGAQQGEARQALGERQPH